MTDSLVSTRVNCALLPNYVGKTVRLTCKPIRITGLSAIVQACDGGEVTINLLPGTNLSPPAYFEVIGSVIDPTTIKMYHCIDLGSDIDLDLVNDTVKLIHDPRFYSKMFVVPE